MDFESHGFELGDELALLADGIGSSGEVVRAKVPVLLFGAGEDVPGDALSVSMI